MSATLEQRAKALEQRAKALGPFLIAVIKSGMRVNSDAQAKPQSFFLRISTSEPSATSKAKVIKYIKDGVTIYGSISSAKDVSKIKLYDGSFEGREVRRVVSALYNGKTYVTPVFSKSGVGDLLTTDARWLRRFRTLAAAVALFKGIAWGRSVVSKAEWGIALRKNVAKVSVADPTAAIPDMEARIVEVSSALQSALQLIMDSYTDETAQLRFKPAKGPKVRAREVAGLTATMKRLVASGSQAVYVNTRKTRKTSTVYFTILGIENKQITKSKKYFLIFSALVNGIQEPLVILAPEDNSDKYIKLLQNTGASRNIAEGYQADEDRGIPRIDNAVYKETNSNAASANQTISRIVAGTWVEPETLF